MKTFVYIDILQNSCLFKNAWAKFIMRRRKLKLIKLSIIWYAYRYDSYLSSASRIECSKNRISKFLEVPWNFLKFLFNIQTPYGYLKAIYRNKFPKVVNPRKLWPSACFQFSDFKNSLHSATTWPRPHITIKMLRIMCSN